MEHIGGDEGDDEASITCSNGNRKASLEFIYCSTVHSFDSLPCESHLYTVSLFGGHAAVILHKKWAATG